MFPAHLGDNTETAGMITTLGDFEINGMCRSQSKSPRIVVGNVSWSRVRECKIDIFIRHHSLDDRAKLCLFVQTDKGIDFRHLFAQVARESLRHATADNQLLAG